MAKEITEEAYRKLKREVETAKSDADRAQGALDQLLGRLKEEFECKSIKDAEALLKTYRTKESNAQEAFAEALVEYEKKWKDDED